MQSIKGGAPAPPFFFGDCIDCKHAKENAK